MKYEFPDHAQRMSNLFASDKLLVPCRSREEGMGGTPHVHACVGWEARKGRGGGGACNVQVRVQQEIGGHDKGGAYVEHIGEAGRGGADAGRVEAQRLVERSRVLPSRKEGIQGRRRVGWEARACGVVAVQGACGRGSEG